VRITIVGNFGLGYKGTMAARAVPIARELGRLGNKVTVLVPADAPGPVKATERVGYRLVEVGTPGAAPRMSAGVTRADGRVWTGLRLTGLALRSKPDVLYAFKPKAYAGLAVLVFWILRKARLTRATIVLDLDDWEGKGGWADREQGRWWERLFISWHERWCIVHADLITVASRELVRLSRRDARFVVSVPNAASESSPGWTPASREKGRAILGVGNEPVVLAYTRFLEYAPDRLLDTFAAILVEVPTARLVIAGKGLHGEEHAFEAGASQRGVDDRIINLGWTRLDVLPAIFAAADVAVYLMDDNLLNRAKCPMKLVDLLLAGVAVVADRVGQANEYINDGSTGRLVQPEDVQAMAAAVSQLLRDEGLRTRIGVAARSAILAGWSWPEQTARIDQAIRGVRGAGRDARAQ
jgi:glycosyltransferase involved in cell wall biosynthesis